MSPPVDRRTLLRSAGVVALAACSGVPVRDEAGPTSAPTPSSSSIDPSPSETASSGPSAPETASAAPTDSPDPTASASPSPSETSSPEPEPSSSPTAESEPEPVPAPEPEPEPTTEPVASGGRPTVEEICRTSLGLPEPRPDDRTHTIAGLMLHHTAVVSDRAAQAPGRLRGHTNYHRDQGWPDIAYHVGVDLDGNVYELRDPSLPGDTFTEYDPSGWFLVVAEGDFNRTTPTPELLEAVSRVFAWAAGTFGVSVDTLAGHRDHASTTCPGDQLHGALGSIRDRARQILAEGGTDHRLVCGDEGDQRVAAIEAG